MILQMVLIIILLLYAVLIGAITVGWWKLKRFEPVVSINGVTISVVVAVRNEEKHVDRLLSSLLSQDYPSDYYEVIIVDDHSTDKTLQLLKDKQTELEASVRLRIISLKSEDGIGKKAAIREGISQSSGELIVTTDADCIAGEKWISTTASFYNKYKPEMILGPVRMTSDGTLFGKLQSLEFVSLIGSAAGACKAGFPILANGANLAFTRKAYDECHGFDSNVQYPSGDDMFLMMNIKQKFGAGAIRFIYSEKAVVDTPATQDRKFFWQQRLRWVSKSSGYTDIMLIATSIIVFLTNACLALVALAPVFRHEFFPAFIFFYCIKLIIDLPLLMGFSRFLNYKSLSWHTPILEIINAFYTSMIGIAGNTGHYKWKDRNVGFKKLV